MMKCRICFPLAAAAVICLSAGAASGTTYTVSPSGPITSLKSIVNTLLPGDVVEVESGVYNEVMKIQCNGTVADPITIRGVGATRPVFDATGQYVVGDAGSPRGVFQVEGDYIVMENLEMTNARNGNNGAGVRLLNSTNFVMRDCAISYNDMGMMGNDTVRALIENCDIGFNGTASYDGYSHNMYMGGMGTIEVRGCYLHDALYGQNFKSRAHYNELWYNWIADSNEGEVGPVDAAETQLSNSNFVMVGNVVVSKPNRTGNSSKYINFGADGGYGHNGTAYIYNNTLIAGSPSIDFIAITDWNNQTHVVVSNNIFYGSSDILKYWWNSYTNHQGSYNWMQNSASVPSGFTNTVQGTTPGCVDLPARDYHLLETSACVDAGTGVLTYLDGNGVLHSVSVNQSYEFGQGLVPRGVAPPLDIGAYEWDGVIEPTTPTLEYTVRYLGDGKYGFQFTVNCHDEELAPVWAEMQYEGYQAAQHQAGYGPGKEG
ncbi:MAG: hypothetical protein AMK72_08415, partial [Planctomycetes bacterium SM23_25]